jgi:hypothetical protein
MTELQLEVHAPLAPLMLLFTYTRFRLCAKAALAEPQTSTSAVTTARITAAQVSGNIACQFRLHIFISSSPHLDSLLTHRAQNKTMKRTCNRSFPQAAYKMIENCALAMTEKAHTPHCDAPHCQV